MPGHTNSHAAWRINLKGKMGINHRGQPSTLGPEGGSGIRSTTIIRMTRCGDMPSCSPCGTIESAPGTAITGGVYNLSSPNTLTTPVTLANVRVGEPSAPRPSR